MIKWDLLKYSFNNVRSRKLRSWLTAVSILIGIAAITALISFGQGLSEYVNEYAEKAGKDKIIVMPRGAALGSPLDTNVVFDDDDVDVIEKVKGIEEATGMYVESVEVEFEDVKKYVFAMGSDFKKHRKLVEETYAIEIDSGENFDGDESSKVVVGYNYMIADKIFPKALKVGDKIKVNGQKVKIKGFYEEIGNPQDDSNVYFTIEGAEKIIGSESYAYIFARAAYGEDMDKLSNSVKKELRDSRNQGAGNEDFFVQTYEQLIETFGSILNTITGVVVIIALISVIIAAINIMNTMYTSVLERTKEIGIMKSIGARNNDILFMFIFESGLIGIGGGAIGVVLGILVAKGAGVAIASAGYAAFQPAFSISLVVGCLLFSFVIGAIAGVLPARRASKMNPIDALRYE